MRLCRLLIVLFSIFFSLSTMANSLKRQELAVDYVNKLLLITLKRGSNWLNGFQEGKKLGVEELPEAIGYTESRHRAYEIYPAVYGSNQYVPSISRSFMIDYSEGRARVELSHPTSQADIKADRDNRVYRYRYDGTTIPVPAAIEVVFGPPVYEGSEVRRISSIVINDIAFDTSRFMSFYYEQARILFKDFENVSHYVTDEMRVAVPASILKEMDSSLSKVSIEGTGSGKGLLGQVTGQQIVGDTLSKDLTEAAVGKSANAKAYLLQESGIRRDDIAKRIKNRWDEKTELARLFPIGLSAAVGIPAVTAIDVFAAFAASGHTFFLDLTLPYLVVPTSFVFLNLMYEATTWLITSGFEAYEKRPYRGAGARRLFVHKVMSSVRRAGSAVGSAIASQMGPKDDEQIEAWNKTQKQMVCQRVFVPRIPVEYYMPAHLGW